MKSNKLLNKMADFLFFIVVMPILFVILLIFLPFAICYLTWSMIVGKICQKRIKKQGYNFILTRSNNNDFDEYILNSLEQCSKVKVFYSKNYRDYPDRYHSLFIRDLYNIKIYFSLEGAYRKFKYNTKKVDNVVKKLVEVDRKMIMGELIEDRGDLNLSNDLDGFGHVQAQKLTRKLKARTKRQRLEYVKPESNFGCYLKKAIIVTLLVLIASSYIRGKVDTFKKTKEKVNLDISILEKVLSEKV